MRSLSNECNNIPDNEELYIKGMGCYRHKIITGWKVAIPILSTEKWRKNGCIIIISIKPFGLGQGPVDQKGHIRRGLTYGISCIGRGPVKAYWKGTSKGNWEWTSKYIMGGNQQGHIERGPARTYWEETSKYILRGNQQEHTERGPVRTY